MFIRRYMYKVSTMYDQFIEKCLYTLVMQGYMYLHDSEMNNNQLKAYMCMRNALSELKVIWPRHKVLENDNVNDKCDDQVMPIACYGSITSVSHTKDSENIHKNNK